MSDDYLIRRGDALKSIETALNNATGDLYDVYSAIRALPAVTPAVKVKPLLWSGGPNSWQADTPFTDDMDEWSFYVVERKDHHWGMWPPGCNDDPKSWHDTEEAAFAAAQADYQARILSALDMTPAPLSPRKEPTMSEHTEYLRRNLLHAASVGANANLDVVLFRLSANKNTPAWLKSSLNGVKDRIRPLPSELARWRDESEDKPTF